MKKVLILVPPFFGHIFPTLSIGQELIKRGYSVCWVGLKEIDSHFLPDNSEFIVPEEVEKNRERVNSIIERQNESTGIPVEEMYSWAFELTWFPFFHIIYEGLKNVVDDFKPDLILTDQCMLAGPIVAIQMQIPFVSSISIQPGMFYPTDLPYANQKWLANRLMDLQKEHGINKDSLIFDSRELNLVYMSKEFINGNRFPQHYHFLGPIVDKRPQPISFDWNKVKNTEWPIVYASLGTVLKDISKKFYQKVVDALKEQELTVIVSADIELFDSWPDNFIVQSYLPQTEILPRVSALITPGGLNTVNEALYFGIPMVVLPMGHDQYGNSNLVKDKGCGIRLRYKRTNGEKLREALYRVLNEESFKEAANKIASFSKCGGASKAVELISEFILKKRIN